MLYTGHIRREIRELRDKLAFVLARDESAAAKLANGDNHAIVVTGEAETREAFFTLLDRCNIALRL